MTGLRRQPPRFVPTLTDVVQAPKPSTTTAIPPEADGLTSKGAYDLDALTKRLEARILSAAHNALQAEIDRFSLHAHERLDAQLRQVIQQALQDD
jgi:hypothetical protein